MTKRRMALALLVTWLAAQIAIAWAPFRLDPPHTVGNGAQYLANGALSFSGAPARARTDPPRSWHTTNSVDVELTFRTEHFEQAGPARLLTVARNHQESNLVIGQDGSGLVIRVRHPGSAGAAREDVHVQDVFTQPGWQRLRVEISDTIRVSVNDEQVAVRRLAANTLSAWDQSYRIALGDAVIGDRPWAGTITEANLTAGGRSYDLLEAGALDVPERYLYVPTRLREAVHAPGMRDVLHSGLHLIAWIPAGAAFVLLLRPMHRRRRVAAVACGLALFLQIGKIAVAARHPSLLDVASQTTGALAGAWIAGFVNVGGHRKRQRGNTATRHARQEPTEVSESRS